MATQTFKNFKTYANLLESELGIKYDAKPYKETIRIMLDGYCKAVDDGDEHLKNLYISGLMLRHWDKGKKLAMKCPNIGMQEEEFMDWVLEAIFLACEYRKWQKDDSVNAQQCINQCIETVRQRHYYEMNLDKHKASYNTLSLNSVIGDQNSEDAVKTLEDTVADEDAELESKNLDGSSSAQQIIQSFIDQRKIVEAIVFDVIAFSDSQKITKTVKKAVDEDGSEYKYVSYSSEFWRFKCAQVLANLPETYYEYFTDKYKVKTEPFLAALNFIKKLNNSKIYKEIDKSLLTAKNLVQEMF